MKIFNTVLSVPYRIIYDEIIFDTVLLVPYENVFIIIFYGPRGIIPMEMKKLPLHTFLREIRIWKPDKCPCTLCKTWIPKLGYVNVTTTQ